MHPKFFMVVNLCSVFCTEVNLSHQAASGGGGFKNLSAYKYSKSHSKQLAVKKFNAHMPYGTMK